jgi:hypothetical protein
VTVGACWLASSGLKGGLCAAFLVSKCTQRVQTAGGPLTPWSCLRRPITGLAMIEDAEKRGKISPGKVRFGPAAYTYCNLSVVCISNPVVLLPCTAHMCVFACRVSQTTLVEPTSGNTGIALAFIAAAKVQVLVDRSASVNVRCQLLHAVRIAHFSFHVLCLFVVCRATSSS